MVFRLYHSGVDINTAAKRVLGSYYTYINHWHWLSDQNMIEMTNNAGINAAHRSPPLACLATISDEELPLVIKLEATITHSHPISVAASLYTTWLIRCLIKGQTIQSAIEHAPRPKTFEV